MLETLTPKETEVLYMLIRGQNYRGITDWLGLDYNEYVKLKRSIFKKLNVTRMNELIYVIWSANLLEEI